MVKYRTPLLPTGFLRQKPREEALALVRMPRELRGMLRDALEATGSTGCSIWELQRLHASILDERPRAAIELGSGVSTLVLAYAARSLALRGDRCRLVSMEQSAEYQDDMLSWFPSELKGYVEFILSPTVEDPQDDGSIGYRYSLTPDEAFEWVFVDGPQLPRKDPALFDADAIGLARHGQRMVVHVDGRESTVDRLVHRLAPERLERSEVHSWTTMWLSGQRSS